jgi:TolB protein
MRARRGYIAGIAAAALASCALLSPATQAYNGANGPLVFQSSRDGDNEIYLLNPDGSGVTKLTDNAAGDVNPVWSPDGTKIAFQTNRDGNVDVWVMDANGGNETQLTNDPAFDGEPTWSFDGTKMAFTSDRDGDREIFTMDADGSNETQLTVNAASDSQPAWSLSQICNPTCDPSGLLAFTSDRDGNDEIYVMHEDGTGPFNLTQNSATDREPAWRDALIAFSTDRGSPPGAPDFDIWDQHVQSSFGGVVVDSPLDEVAPAGSPDGSRIAYERDDGNREIYVTNPGANVTNAATNERAPDWKPEPPVSDGHARPRGATPLRVSLAPAFAPCTATNRMHGPPLSFGSCAPPSALSPNITIGSPDSNDSQGGAANALMSVRLDVIVGSPGPPNDSDVRVAGSMTDIRCRAALSTCGAANGTGTADYTGEMQIVLPFRITDRWSASVPGGGENHATGQLTITAPVGCQSTSSTSIGGSCAVTTSIAALVGAPWPDGKRTVMELDQLFVRDGGPDGSAGTADNSVFAKQAVYIP